MSLSRLPRAAREESIVFYLERDGADLEGVPHAEPATATGGGIGPKDRVEPRDQVLQLAVGPLDDLADVQNRSFLQVVSLWSRGAPSRPACRNQRHPSAGASVREGLDSTLMGSRMATSLGAPESPSFYGLATEDVYPE